MNRNLKFILIFLSINAPLYVNANTDNIQIEYSLDKKTYFELEEIFLHVKYINNSNFVDSIIIDENLPMQINIINDKGAGILKEHWHIDFFGPLPYTIINPNDNLLSH